MKAILAALVILAATLAFGQVGPKYAEWADGPVHHLMTRDEMKQWKALQTDAEAQAFIDLFWARRDPTPDTPRNEFHEAFDKRVATADQYFSSANKRGAMSDPGKVLILLGPPYTISGSAGAPSTSMSGGLTVPTNTDGSVALPRPTAGENKQVWNYAHERKPPYISDPDFVLVFLDAGKNEWQLGYTERTNPQRILQQAVNGLIVSPNLKKAPFSSEAAPARATAFRDLILDAAYKEFRNGEKPSVGPAALTWGEFVSPEGDHFASAQLYVPAGSTITPGQKVTFFDVIEDASGKIVEIDEEPTTMDANGNDAYAQKSLLLDPGTYTATFGLAADGHILSATRTEMKIEGLDPAAAAVSPLILSNNIYPLKTTWRATDPFTFGGLKVIPKGDAVFTPKGDLWYFVELRNPGVDGGVPKVQVKIDIQGKTAKGPVEMKLPMAPAEAAPLSGEKNRYALGLAIPLETFVPGDYTIKVHVVDSVLGKNYDLERQFHVHGL